MLVHNTAYNLTCTVQARLENDLKPVAARWYDLGVHLGLDTGVLDGVSGKEHQTEKCFTQTLTEWWNNNPVPRKWEPIIAALKTEAVGYKALACTLEDSQG